MRKMENDPLADEATFWNASRFAGRETLARSRGHKAQLGLRLNVTGGAAGVSLGEWSPPTALAIQ
jgi:hypothetical protein